MRVNAYLHIVILKLYFRCKTYPGLITKEWRWTYNAARWPAQRLNKGLWACRRFCGGLLASGRPDRPQRGTGVSHVYEWLWAASGTRLSRASRRRVTCDSWLGAQKSSGSFLIVHQGRVGKAQPHITFSFISRHRHYERAHEEGYSVKSVTPVVLKCVCPVW